MKREKTNCDGSTHRGGLSFLEELLELPPGLATGMAHIDLMGNREAIVDGCRGILEYGDSVIRLNTGKSIVKFTGRELYIRSLTGTQAIVDGFILTIEFES